MAAIERTPETTQLLEPGRGVYDSHRAAALSGVPISTLHYWARTGLYTPSVSPSPRTRLWSWGDLLALRAIDWSWGDLLALRAIDWFRKGDADRAKASVPNIRRALQELESAGYTRGALSHILAISGGDGKLYLQLPGKTIRADSGGQLVIADTLTLVAPYRNGPDLLQPRPLLRIIPGKLHGEPHIVNTRIPSLTIASLASAGYTIEQIHEMYPDATIDALRVAIDFERSLATAVAA